MQAINSSRYCFTFDNNVLSWAPTCSMSGKAMKELPSKKPLSVVNYLKLDHRHLAKLLKLIDVNYVTTELEGRPIIHASFSLPGGFVVDTDFNAAMDTSLFDLEYGKKLLREKNLVAMEDKLAEFEGYRIYRILTTINNLGVPVDAIQAMANGAYVGDMQNGEVAIWSGNLEDRGFVNYVWVINATAYYTIRAHLNTYIEY